MTPTACIAKYTEMMSPQANDIHAESSLKSPAPAALCACTVHTLFQMFRWSTSCRPTADSLGDFRLCTSRFGEDCPFTDAGFAHHPRFRSSVRREGVGNRRVLTKRSRVRFPGQARGMLSRWRETSIRQNLYVRGRSRPSWARLWPSPFSGPCEWQIWTVSRSLSGWTSKPSRFSTSVIARTRSARPSANSTRRNSGTGRRSVRDQGSRRWDFASDDEVVKLFGK
jgi:hypothetical protein